MNAKVARSAGASAIGFVVLVVITIIISGSPPASDADKIEKIREYFIDHRGAILTGGVLQLLAVPLVIWFFVNVRQAVRGGDAATNALGMAAVAGIVLGGACALGGQAAIGSTVWTKGFGESLSDDVVLVVYNLQSLLFVSASAGIGLAAGASAWAGKRTGALPAASVWLGALAVVGNLVAIFSFLGSGALVLGLAGIVTFLLFLLVTGVWMIRQGAAIA